uniref:Uncharacterized protein n=1 Tax=Arundo donax TaxID=35708 RepID=A0A0A8Z1F8_ARUDO
MVIGLFSNRDNEILNRTKQKA